MDYGSGTAEQGYECSAVLFFAARSDRTIPPIKPCGASGH